MKSLQPTTCQILRLVSFSGVFFVPCNGVLSVDGKGFLCEKLNHGRE